MSQTLFNFVNYVLNMSFALSKGLVFYPYSQIFKIAPPPLLPYSLGSRFLQAG